MIHIDTKATASKRKTQTHRGTVGQIVTGRMMSLALQMSNHIFLQSASAMANVTNVNTRPTMCSTARIVHGQEIQRTRNASMFKRSQRIVVRYDRDVSNNIVVVVVVSGDGNAELRTSMNDERNGSSQTTTLR
jgi:hypothetical protein